MKSSQAKHRQLARERFRNERNHTGRKEKGTALLVCEGQCTEPFYLQGLMEYLGISSASVEIIRGQSKSNAVAVVKRARERFQQMPRDQVFVIIDGEQADLEKAIKLCSKPVQHERKKNHLPEIRIMPIITTPCFEYWLLLHFRYCDRCFSKYTDVLSELKIYLPDYSKTDARIFERVGGAVGLNRAIAHVKQLKKSQVQTLTGQPGTDMDRLVEALRVLQDQSL